MIRLIYHGLLLTDTQVSSICKMVQLEWVICGIAKNGTDKAGSLKSVFLDKQIYKVK